MACKITRLSSILGIRNGTHSNDAMQSHIISILKQIPNVKYSVDIDSKAIYALKRTDDTYPIFVCHTDGVTVTDTDYKIVRLTGNNWVSYKSNEHAIVHLPLNAASKSSVYLTLRLLETLDNVGCVFFPDLLSGNHSAKNPVKEFFEAGKWVLELGGAGLTTLVTKTVNGELCTNAFSDVLGWRSKKFSLTLGEGGFGMAAILKQHANIDLSMAVVPSGYWRPFSPYEHLSEKGLFNAFEFCKEFGSNVTGVFKHKRSVYQLGQGSTLTQSATASICNTKACTNKLAVHDLYFCQDCKNAMVKAGVNCIVCKRLLFTSTEFYYTKCITCYNKVG